MMTINPDSNVPLVDQIEHAIRVAIASGEVLPGAELPPVRQLANDLDVNLNTVARAYRQLHRCGLVRCARGRNTRVTAAREAPRQTRSLAVRRATAGVRNTLADAKLAGLSRHEMQRILDTELESFWRTQSQRSA